MKYRYVAYDLQGRKVKGVVEAGSETDAIYYIRCQDLSPVFVGPQKEKAASIWEIEIMEPEVHDLKMSRKALSQFAEKMSIMLHAGVALSTAMDVMISGEKNRRRGKIYRAMRADLYAGLSLADSMRSFRAFPNEFVNMIASGEQNGKLDWAFEKTAELYKKQLDFSTKVMSAFAYPVFLLFLWAAMFVVMTVVVLPRFSEMYDRFDAKLPGITLFMLRISELMEHYGLAFLLLLVAFAVLFVFFMKKNAAFSGKTSAFALKIPLYGHLSLISNTSRFTQVAAALLQTGVELVDSLQIAAAVIANPHISRAVYAAVDEISRGAKLYYALQKADVFEPLLISMVQIAEEASMVPETFAKLAELYEKESAAAIRKTTAVLEPVLTLIIGVMIAAMVFAVVLPMFGMYTAISGQ